MEDLHKKFIDREKSRYKLAIDQIESQTKIYETEYRNVGDDVKLLETLTYQASKNKEDEPLELGSIIEQTNQVSQPNSHKRNSSINQRQFKPRKRMQSAKA